MFRITLWSGGQPSLTFHIKEQPKFDQGMVAFRSDDGTVVRLTGSISIEEGEFAERINTVRRR